jgi:hypothetical protein
MDKYRYIEITTYPNNKYYNVFKSIKSNKDTNKEIKKRNIIININTIKDNTFLLELIGYDGEVKYRTKTFDNTTMDYIFELIDSMPIGKIEKKEWTDGNYKSKYHKYKMKYLGLKYYIDHVIK